MIFNTTVPNDEVIKAINSNVGPPFSLWTRIKLNGIGSRRMIIDQYHSSFKKYLHEDHYLTYCNIELRPNGILIHITKRHQVFSWVIPFYKLVIFKSRKYTIHSDELYLQFRNAHKANKSFFNKIIKHKGEFVNRVTR